MIHRKTSTIAREADVSVLKMVDKQTPKYTSKDMHAKREEFSHQAREKSHLRDEIFLVCSGMLG